MLHKHGLFIFITGICISLIGLAWAENFVEDFTTTTYKDPNLTSAEWDTSSGGEVRLPSSYSFSLPSGVVNWGGQINAIAYNGSYWLIGGKGAKINLYDGSTYTSLSTELSGFTGNDIRGINFGNGYWLILGNAQKLNQYDGSTWTDLSTSLLNWSGANAVSAGYGAGTDNFWLIGGEQGKFNKYNGVSFTDLSYTGAATRVPWGNSTTAYSAVFNGTYWLIGCNNGYLVKYQTGTFTNIGFGVAAVYSIVWNAGSNSWLVGGSNGRLVSYNGSTLVPTDRSLSVSSFNNIYNIAHNGSYYLMVGNNSGGGVVYSWDGSTFRDLSSYLVNMGSGIPLYAVAGNSTEWLLGGVQARMNNHTGSESSVTFNDRSGELVEFGIDDINSVGYNTTDHYWLFGGSNRHLNKYNGTSFEDVTGALSGFGGTDSIRCIGYGGGAGNYWLIGGSNGKLNRYNGVSSTDLTSALGFGAGVAVNVVRWNGTEWLIGGDNAHLTRYNGSGFSNLTLQNFAGESVKSLDYANGFWLIGGSNGCVNLFDGSLFGDLRANLLGTMGGYYNINSVATDGLDFFLGADNGHLSRYVVATDTFINYTSNLSSIFASSNVMSMIWSTTQNCLMIGGQNAKLAFFYLPDMMSDQSDGLIGFETSSILNMAAGGDVYFLAGTTAKMNQFAPTYESPKSAQSTLVAASTAFFNSVTLTAVDSMPAGTTINYWLTANGQLSDPHAYWIQATPGTATIFNSAFEGQRLKWKAELSTTDTSVSPHIYQLNLNFYIPPTPTHTKTSTATPTITPSITRTPTLTPSVTPTPTISVTFTRSPTISPTRTQVIFSPTISPTPSRTPTNSPTTTLTPIYSPTASATISVTQTWTASPTATPNPDLTFYPGTLIIPMDTTAGRTNQNNGMFRAYGFVYRLLSAGIPVHWAIKSYKAYEANDFAVTQTKCLRTGATYTNPAYNGGPFLIAASNSPQAWALWNNWNTTWGTGNRVEMHQYTGVSAFTAPIFRKLRSAPSIGIYHNNDPRDTFLDACKYLNAARIPDSNGNTWPSSTSQAPYSSWPDVMTEAQIAGTGNGWTGNHHDGSLFIAGGLPKYCQVVNMHWDAYALGDNGDGMVASDTAAESVAEIETYANYNSAHVYAQCISVNAFENDIVSTTITPYSRETYIYGGHGRWLTTNGFIDTSTPITKTAINQEVAFSPFAQATGQWTTATGAQTAFNLYTGSVFLGGTSTIIQYNLASSGATYPYMFMTGYYKGVTSAGKVSYMCQHSSGWSTPYSSNSTGPAMRYFYNSMFEAPNTSETVPEMYLTKTGPGEAEVGSRITYTIAYQNVSGIAYNVVLTDPYPTNTTYFSSTGGGVPGGGVVTWNLGNLDVGAAGVVTITYTLNAAAGWDNQARVVYKTGPTQFTAYSQNVHTTAVMFTPTPSITRTSTRTPTITQTRTPTLTPSKTSTSTQTMTMTGTFTLTPSITRTATISPTRTITPDWTMTATPTISATSTISATYTITKTITYTPTVTQTSTITKTSTITSTSTQSPTYTVSATFTITVTPSFTPTVTLTSIPTGTSTITCTVTPVQTPEVIYVFPNPFNPAKARDGVLKFDNVPPDSTVKIFTITGELVRRFEQVEGRVSWDGKNEKQEDVVSGVYLYIVNRQDGQKVNGKIFLVR